MSPNSLPAASCRLGLWLTMIVFFRAVGGVYSNSRRALARRSFSRGATTSPPSVTSTEGVPGKETWPTANRSRTAKSRRRRACTTRGKRTAPPFSHSKSSRRERAKRSHRAPIILTLCRPNSPKAPQGYVEGTFAERSSLSAAVWLAAIRIFGNPQLETQPKVFAKRFRVSYPAVLRMFNKVENG
jgi:hypothetical protein